MIRKILWMVILLIMTACTIFYTNDGNDLFDDPTPTPVGCADCTAEPTTIGGTTETAVPTEEITPVVDLTATAISLTEEPTATALPTQTLAATATLVPTKTSTAVPPTATKTTVPPTATKTAIPPTATKTAIPPTATSTIAAIYVVQPVTPVFMQNFVHTTEGCAWQGVAGQIFDASGKPVTNLIIKVSGTWDGAAFDQVGITGMVSGLPYGPGSYEIVLGNEAMDTVDQLKIQVFKADQTPLTNPISFSTSADCSKNLVLINFKAK